MGGWGDISGKILEIDFQLVEIAIGCFQFILTIFTIFTMVRTVPGRKYISRRTQGMFENINSVLWDEDCCFPDKWIEFHIILSR